MRRGLQAGDGAGGGSIPGGASPGRTRRPDSRAAFVMNGKNAMGGGCTCACGKVGCLVTALSTGDTGGQWLQFRGNRRLSTPLYTFALAGTSLSGIS